MFKTKFGKKKQCGSELEKEYDKNAYSPNM